MKVFLKFFLSLCILFIGGYGYSHSHKAIHNTQANNYAPVKILKNQASINSDVIRSVAELRAHFHEPKEEKNQIKAREVSEEDEDDSSSKKRPDAQKYFSTLLYSRTSGNFCQNIIQSLPFCKPLSSFSVHKYLMLCVIRI